MKKERTIVSERAQSREIAIMTSRRSFLKSSAVLTGSFVVVSPGRAAPEAMIEETKIISQFPSNYHGWPTLAQRKNGELLAVCSGGREGHVCPFGRVEFMKSNDGGESWCFPRVVLDGPIDDRDAGIVETAKGSILITNFTSNAYEGPLGKKSGEDLRRWKAAHHRSDAEGRKKALGSWMIRSTNGGLSFSGRYPVPLNSPHGPIQLSDGRLLYAGKALWTPESKVGVCESKDDGLSWQWLSDIPTRKGDAHKSYHELHAAETQDGKLVVQIRNHNSRNAGESLQCESSDGGRTWSDPQAIGVWGLPSHLLRLRDGRLLMSYGYRRKPFGNQARLSEDGGTTWSEPITISGDGVSGDLGYPSTVELVAGQFLSVWYEKMAGSPRAVLRQARWRLA
jgi:sialidase-1